MQSEKLIGIINVSSPFKKECLQTIF